ncbi:unnamed protein product [Hermetia illucens]|uniref:Voltage-dependent calcium channel subunit alpha-2/delta-3 n=1 Tax=Hermetia illucens TaxID=343691 RepID=A0A7R8YTU1_HERIL|nr:unnamed protein product [Hermetia illucens]
MACTNKGYFVQINSLEDAREKVIEYALVMARPMVMYQQDHPIHWSPVFMAGMSSGLGQENNNKRRLVTTVSTPVFDRRNYSIRVANILGVVGTDVPIEEIQKMIPQYKLGVNGYSFIIDNNGRVLYHPDLRPLSDNGQYIDQLKPKYSSGDITEIELPDTEFQDDPDLLEENKNLLHDMRYEMIQQHRGETELRVLTHFDSMKRVASRTLKYFYGPIEGTPFALALALPDKYGSHELVSHQEIRHSRSNVTEYFKGDNWRVHPDWVYCEYNSISDLEKERESSGEILSRDQEPSFSTPEEQVLHFLARAGRPGWKWMSVRPRSPQPHHGHGASPLGHFAQHVSGQGSRKAEPYFCDRTLIQSLVRDAMITDGLDKPSTQNTHKEVQQGISMFNVTTTFVATRSGLLRWVDHMEHPSDSSEPHFSEINARAMDMSWYRRAVDQYAVEPDSFVYSVPFDSGYTDNSNATLVTATHAIFIDHRGHKAPAAVVGLLFRHDSLARHFVNITSACSGCHKTCASDELDCYLLDNNGFIILSENSEHTGKFFGQIDGTIMDSLVQDRIYKRITIMDYQGVCSDKDNPYTASAHVIQPSKPMQWFFKYIISFTTTWLSFLPKPVIPWPAQQYIDGEEYELEGVGDIDDGEYDGEYETDQYSDLPYNIDEATTKDYERTTLPPKIQIHSSGPRKAPDPKHARSCDLKTDLYVLQPERLNQSGQNNPLKGKLTNCHSSGCERPFSVQKIPHSNLILLVVDTLCPCGSKQLDIEPVEIPGGIGACGTRRQARESLSRKRPAKCISYHPEEVEIQQCGRGSHLFAKSIVLSHLIVLLITFALTYV